MLITGRSYARNVICQRATSSRFPVNFEFKGPPEQIRKQIGMAVPTLGARQIFMAILKTFAKIDYAFVEPDPELVVYPER